MDHPDYPIGGMHLPSKVFMALINHAGEAAYGDKSAAALSVLIRQWVATTPAACCAWLEDDDEPDDSAAGAAPAAPPQPVPMQPVPMQAASGPSNNPDTSRGYQWKQLFLPNGTELRAIYCGRSSYATVEDEQIISDSGPTTPSRLANRKGCGTRNAWQTIWVRLPGSTRWRRADDYRRND